MLGIDKYPDISVQWLVVNDLSTINVITIDICHSCVINLECKVWNQITFQFYFLDIFPITVILHVANIKGQC